jgi:hypothetical protein
MSIFKKKEDHELYTSFIQINATNPKMNNLITISNGVEIFPTEARVETTFDVPIENVYDITLLSFYFSNQYYRITDKNNKLKVTFYVGENPQGPGVPEHGGKYAFTLTVDPGNYTAETLELELNTQYKELGSKFPDVDYEVPLIDSNVVPAVNPQFKLTLPTFSNPDFKPFQLVGHGEYKYVGHTVMTFPIPASTIFFIHSNTTDTYQSESLDRVLGFYKDAKDDSNNSGRHATIGVQDEKLVSQSYHNVEFIESQIHISSDAIANISETLPSFNSLNKSNIIHTINVEQGSATTLIYHNQYPDITRIRTQPWSRLKNIDITLLNDKYEVIPNNKNETFNMTFAVRTLKEMD